jgi:hypothetical protein
VSEGEHLTTRGAFLTRNTSRRRGFVVAELLAIVALVAGVASWAMRTPNIDRSEAECIGALRAVIELERSTPTASPPLPPTTGGVASPAAPTGEQVLAAIAKLRQEADRICAQADELSAVEKRRAESEILRNQAEANELNTSGLVSFATALVAAIGASVVGLVTWALSRRSPDT